MSDLQDLFDKDPLSLTRADFEEIISHMRKARASFNLGNMKAGSTKPKTEKQKQISELSDKLGITL